MPALKVAVVILNYNGKSFLQQFLPSVLKHSPKDSVYVADNASTDDSISFLTSEFPEVKRIQNAHNFGYAGGYNHALKSLEADYYVLLNSDVRVTENWLDPLIKLLDSFPEVAACQPKLLDLSHPNSFEYAGGSGGFIDFLGYPFCRGRLFETLEEDQSQYNTSVPIFWASGACFAVRSEVFKKAGGFDGDFFAHMEEIDLCWRIKNMGYQIRVEPQSIVYHLGGGTLQKQSTQKTYLNFRNNISTLFKNESTLKLLYKIPIRLLLDGAAGIKFILSGQFLHALAILRGHFSFYFWLPQLIRKRKSNQQLPDFSYTHSEMYKGSIVIEHYLLQIKTFSRLKRGFFSEKK